MLPCLRVCRRSSPARRVHGRLRVPGDKSISHRYALLAAWPTGTSRLSNYAPGADCRSTLACLQALGRRDPDQAATSSLYWDEVSDGWRSPAGPLDAGNSGTTMRMLAGVLAGQPFTATLVGDASLSRRPMRRVIEPLTRMGARIEATDGHAPLTVHGAPLHAIAYRPDVPSAQVKSAVLLAGLHADGTTSVTEPAQTRDHTERALAAFGFDVSVDGPDGLGRGRPARRRRRRSPCPATSRPPRSGWSRPRRCPGRASRSRTSA